MIPLPLTIPSQNKAGKSISKGLLPCSRTFQGSLDSNRLSSNFLWVKDSKSGAEGIRLGFRKDGGQIRGDREVEEKQRREADRRLRDTGRPCSLSSL